MTENARRGWVADLVESMSDTDRRRILTHVLWDIFGAADENGKEYIDFERRPDKFDIALLIANLRTEFWPQGEKAPRSQEASSEQTGKRMSVTRRLAIGLFTLSEYEHSIKLTRAPDDGLYHVDVRCRIVSFEDCRVLDALGWTYLVGGGAWTFTLEAPKDGQPGD